MTGPEHYREAERLLDRVMDPGLSELAKRKGWTARQTEAGLTATLAQAQVHATLALAAAQVDTAGGIYQAHGTVRDWTEWNEVLQP